MSVARFIADQRTNYRVPVAVVLRDPRACRRAGSTSGSRPPVTGQLRRRRELDAEVAGVVRGLGRDLRLAADPPGSARGGLAVGENTVADSMRRQGLSGRKPKRRKGLTKQDRRRAEVPGPAAPRLHRRRHRTSSGAAT